MSQPLGQGNLDAGRPAQTPQSKSHTQKRCAFLKEWIDGTTMQKIDETSGKSVDGEAPEFVWSLYEHVLKLLSTIVTLSSEHSTKALKKNTKYLKDCLGSLFLWGDGLRDGKLDIILAESDDLKETVIGALARVGSILMIKLLPTNRLRAFSNLPAGDSLDQQVTELEILLEKARVVIQDDFENNTSSEDEGYHAPTNRIDHARYIGCLKTYINCLMDLLPAMEDTLAYISHTKQDHEASAAVDFQVSGPAQAYVLKIQDRFLYAEPRLVQRLGEANWQRHLILRKGDRLLKNHEAPKSLFVPFSLFHDSGLGSSLPTKSSYTATIASHSSFVSSLAEVKGDRLRVPSTPKEVFEGRPFSCIICEHVLTKIRNRIDWKRHVFSDLKPYICTFTGCKDELLTFPTRQLWEEHEFGQHRVLCNWSCSMCTLSFPALELWKSHLDGHHNLHLDGKMLEVASTMAQKWTAQAIESQQCPLCNCVPGKSRRYFANHVAKHMEGIALAALPRETDSDSDSDYESIRLGDDRARSDHSQSDDEEIDPDEPTYCYCNDVSYGEMVGCDSETCSTEWFHLECVGLKVAPRGAEKWFCDDCKEGHMSQHSKGYDLGAFIEDNELDERSRRDSHLTKAVKHKFDPTSPPPDLPYFDTPPPPSANSRKPDPRRRPVPSQGDALLINFLGSGRKPMEATETKKNY